MFLVFDKQYTTVNVTRPASCAEDVFLNQGEWGLMGSADRKRFHELFRLGSRNRASR